MMEPNFGHSGVSNGRDFFLDIWGDGPLLIRHNGREWLFEFSEMFGPIVLTKQFDPAERQPISERNPFWRPFNRWLSGGKKCRPVFTKRGKFRFYLCHVPVQK